MFIIEVVDMTFDYLLCPFCSWTRLIHSSRYEDGVLKLRDFEIEPADFNIIQIREALPGPGRGHKGSGVGGFQVVDEMTIQQMLEDPRYRELASQVKRRLIRIVRSYIAAGILSVEELLSDEQTAHVRVA
jgi:hypothetical protein